VSILKGKEEQGFVVFLSTCTGALALLTASTELARSRRPEQSEKLTQFSTNF
jgi:hypothetical protein